MSNSSDALRNRWTKKTSEYEDEYQVVKFVWKWATTIHCRCTVGNIEIGVVYQSEEKDWIWMTPTKDGWCKDQLKAQEMVEKSHLNWIYESMK